MFQIRLTSLWVALVLAGSFPAPGLSQKAGDREGYLVYQNQRTGSSTIYYMRLQGDSLVYLREGMAEGGPSTLIPQIIVKTLSSQIQQAVKVDSTTREQLALSYRDSRLSLLYSRPVNLVLVLSLAGLLVVSVIVVIRLNSRLKRERYSRQLIAESRRRLAEGREAERRRLAQEIHDGPVQDLHALRMQFALQQRTAESTVDSKNPGVEEELLSVARELRAMCEDLRPPALGPFGFAAALQSHVERFRTRHPSLEVKLETVQDEQKLSEYVRIALFRVAQEALNNAAAHSGADRLTIQFFMDERDVVLEIEDNGRGFDVPVSLNDLGRDGHYGLLGISERAESIGADLEIASSPGKGTRIHVRMRQPDQEKKRHPRFPAIRRDREVLTT